LFVLTICGDTVVYLYCLCDCITGGDMWEVIGTHEWRDTTRA